MMTLDPFYPIVDRANWVSRLVGVGARLIQLRMKDQPAGEIEDDVRKALATCKAAAAQLIVNDYWELALDTGADFIHLGQEDLDGADLKAIRRRGIRLGVSTHDHAELDRALAINPDYVALGPIYPTSLKAMAWLPQGLERIGEWKRLVGNRPLVAIGGITLERAPLCLAAGADSVAVVSDIVRAADPEAQAKSWIAQTRAHPQG